MVCRLMMCESFEVMASGTLVGMVPAAFVNACMSTDQCLPILVEWADLGRGAWNRPFPSASRLSAEVWGRVREGAADPQVRTERRWNTTSVSRETREAVVAPAPEVCRATVSKRSGTGRCGFQAAIEEWVWQSAESRRLPRCVAWAMTRMRLYAYVLFRVVARCARN